MFSIEDSSFTLRLIILRHSKGNVYSGVASLMIKWRVMSFSSKDVAFGNTTEENLNNSSKLTY